MGCLKSWPCWRFSFYLGLLADSLTLRMCEGVKGRVQTHPPVTGVDTGAFKKKMSVKIPHPNHKHDAPVAPTQTLYTSIICQGIHTTALISHINANGSERLMISLVMYSYEANMVRITVLTPESHDLMPFYNLLSASSHLDAYLFFSYLFFGNPPKN